VICAILAGGASRRFGSDKARWRPVPAGPPQLERLASLATGAGLRALVVGRDRPEDWSGPAALWIRDRHPGCGPLGGLATALAVAGPGPVVVIACDLPWLAADGLAWLAHAAVRVGDGPGLIAADAAGVPQPLFGVYQPAALPLVERAVADGDLALHRLVRAAGMAILPLSADLVSQAADCDEPPA
jgi:molybdenum cofactor guanylyltransferase